MNGPTGDLDAHLDKRRKELGLRWRDIADRAGISEETIRLMRRGTAHRGERATATESRIEDAVRWARGSIAAIRAGGDPEPINGTVRVTGARASTEPVANADHIDDELARWIDDARRHDEDVMSWDLNDRLEREIFIHHRFNWREKTGMREVLRAYRAHARERERRERDATPANGATDG